ncbi:MAG: hypothetical protein DI606_10530 [Sphingobium sp.]|uniref:hypothetical protein n=1 Tax=Sphingobium sp. TaxID=1912891 RepID=UPI000DB4FCA0|nr:hypothetical protein [Sphingobium sp.]PZU12108.1 MAG: hypothetical protein DI606_10530 [Sphingobium sp.]
MAIIHDTIKIPAGGVMPTLGMLMGDHTSRQEHSDLIDENGDVRGGSLFGAEGDKMREDFVKRHIDPLNRTAYHLKRGSEK